MRRRGEEEQVGTERLLVLQVAVPVRLRGSATFEDSCRLGVGARSCRSHCRWCVMWSLATVFAVCRQMVRASSGVHSSKEWNRRREKEENKEEGLSETVQSRSNNHSLTHGTAGARVSASRDGAEPTKVSVSFFFFRRQWAPTEGETGSCTAGDGYYEVG